MKELKIGELKPYEYYNCREYKNMLYLGFVDNKYTFIINSVSGITINSLKLKNININKIKNHFKIKKNNLGYEYIENKKLFSFNYGIHYIKFNLAIKNKLNNILNR